ncbi:MAG: ArsR/SmtB family transcription factor [Bryobacteraceae bacterium]
MADSLRQLKAEILQALAHPTRIAIVEELHGGELSVRQIIERLELEQANASQHLAVLRSRNVVAWRKDGNQVFYSLRHPVFAEVLVLLRQACLSIVSDSRQLLEQIRREEAQQGARRRARA